MTLRCLIVDDSPAFVAAARSLLERHDITVLAATTSADALRLSTELHPDVLLIDIDLGPDSGLDLARRLTRSTGPAAPPVILISTHAEDDYTDLIADTPALGFIAKTDLSATAIRALLDHQR